MYAKEMLTTHFEFLKREKERLNKFLIELESQVRDMKIEIKNNDQNIDDVKLALDKLVRGE